MLAALTLAAALLPAQARSPGIDATIAKVEQMPRMEGRQMLMVLAPK